MQPPKVVEEDDVPLLTQEEQKHKQFQQQLSQRQSSSSISSISSNISEFNYESKKLWQIAGPAIFTSISQYSMGALTQTFAGQVGELELAAVSMENSVIAGLAFGVMAKLEEKFDFSSFRVRNRWESYMIDE